MDRGPRTLPRWLDAFAILAAAGSMVAWTWRTWPDPLVDFGRELYVPWQINLGHTLYRDIAYFNGPLSPYLNALLMRVFGIGLTTLIVANLVIVAAILTLLYLLLNLAADRLAALVGCLFFVAVFGFGRIVAIGSQNFVCPYSHEITHGVALSLAALACLYLPRRLAIGNVAAAGLLTGLALLTKVEVALACVAGVFVGFVLRAAIEPLPRIRKLAAVLCVTSIAPVALAFSILSLRMPASAALEGTLGSFYWAAKSKVASSAFYRLQMGLDHLDSNLILIAIATGILCAAAALALSAGFLAAKIAFLRRHKFAAPLAFLVVFILGLFTIHSLIWFNTIPKALPLVMVLLIVLWAVAYLHEFRSPDRARVLGLRVTLALFALALLLKILFNTRLYHYGFALAMPAMLLLLAAFLSWGANFAGRRFADATVVKSVALAMTAVMVVAYLTAVSSALGKVHVPVASGSDFFYGDGRGAAVEATLQWIRQSTPPNSTIIVLPEGVMINYLSRRANPTTYVNFMPPEVIMFGEDNIVNAFNAHPPDFVVLVHKDTTEYGVPFFARDYGQKIALWVHDNYQPMMLLGDPPFIATDRFGIVILRRRPMPSAN